MNKIRVFALKYPKNFSPAAGFYYFYFFKIQKSEFAFIILNFFWQKSEFALIILTLRGDIINSPVALWELVKFIRHDISALIELIVGIRRCRMVV